MPIITEKNACELSMIFCEKVLYPAYVAKENIVLTEYNDDFDYFVIWAPYLNNVTDVG